MSTALKYRPEIDGLRAIAVTSVLVSHAEFNWGEHTVLPGGFIGVDIFFVISGYLITSIILGGLAGGTFSFADFYERRARRILPTLLVVLAATLPFATALMLPEALKDYAGSLISALFSVSNVWFWLGDDYFADPSALKPLLHTWSLAIEEQFYFVFPIMLVLLWRLVHERLLAVFIGLTVVSLAIAQYGSEAFPVANFFLLPSRAWELSAGAILAQLTLAHGRPTHALLGRLMPGLGLALLVGSLLYFDDDVRHPSLITVAPVLGTMLIIGFARPGEPVTRLLSSRPFVGIGLISYSLYLWHYPLFAFARILSDDGKLSNGLSAAILLASAVLAVVGYFLIETPIRSKRRFRFRLVGPSLGIVATVLVAGSGYVYLSNGLAGAVRGADPLVARIHQGPLRATLSVDGATCHSRDPDKLCTFTSADDKATVIGLGDSFIDAQGLSLKTASNAAGWGYIHDSQSGCPWIPDMIEIVRSEKKDVLYKRCNDIVDAQGVFLRSQPKDKPTYVVYQFADGYGPKVARGEIVFKNGETFASAIHKTLSLLEREGYRVVLVYPLPEAPEHIPRKILAAFRNEAEMSDADRRRVYADLQIPYDVAMAQTAELRKIFDDYPSPNVLRVDPFETFCSKDAGICRTHDETHLFYADSAHLADVGAEMLTARIVDAIARDLKVKPAVLSN